MRVARGEDGELVGLSPEPCGGAGQRIRALSPLSLRLLHEDNTQYESFMRAGGGGMGGVFLLITHTALLSFTYFALFSSLPGESSSIACGEKTTKKKIK